MDREMSARLDRIEVSFNALIESIRSYNPSATATDDLLEADRLLTGALQRLARHQLNHRIIIQLRRTAEDLDAQVRSAVGRLADLRRDIQQSHWTEYVPSESTRVDIRSLLDYANQIARTSVPPGYRHRAVIPQSSEYEGTINKHEVLDGQELVNGANQTLAREAGEAQKGLPGTPEAMRSSDERGRAWEKMADWQKALLDEARDAPYVPWPNETTLRMGALANIQAMTERGEEPWSNLGATEHNDNDDPQNDGEREGTRQNDKSGDLGGRSSGFGVMGSVKSRQPQTAGFGLYDPDDEDEG